MVHFVTSNGRRSPATMVKLEIVDSLEDEHAPIFKKQKTFSAHHQLTAGNSSFPSQPSQYNPLEEPSPLGLRLKKSPSLLELIQMRLSQGNSSTFGPTPSNDFKGNAKNGAATCATDKLKASNFPASLLQIGSWEYTSRYEGDLIAKCYFAKHKLVWEVLDGGLKSKIEIQWADIMGLKADFQDDAPATLVVLLARQPLFFRETNPQPRKHTLWQATTDFTNGQASLNRKHVLQIPHGLLNKHFEKLIECDMRLNFLSRQPEITLDSPYFELKPSVFNDTNKSKSHCIDQREISSGTSLSIFEDISTPSASHSSCTSIKQEGGLHGSCEMLSREATSASSVMCATEASTGSDSGNLKNSQSFEHLIKQGIRPSMSLSDLVNHIGNCISGQTNSENPSFTEDDSGSRKMLEDITQHLLGDFQFAPFSDEKSLMSRVNSLCSLIHIDGPAVPSFQVLEDGKDSKDPDRGSINVPDLKHKQVPSMPRIDSLGDLLLQLPRIASLPNFLFDISEDGDSQVR
ncbi:uncharacterized protein LOC141637680 [Silene latifolia]|uniref:uncharacterized protein LOC141637680 n=1 Tax=Silene latifolia TaxID=37657 RepID=UPI003D7764DE